MDDLKALLKFLKDLKDEHQSLGFKADRLPSSSVLYRRKLRSKQVEIQKQIIDTIERIHQMVQGR